MQKKLTVLVRLHETMQKKKKRKKEKKKKRKKKKCKKNAKKKMKTESYSEPIQILTLVLDK